MVKKSVLFGSLLAAACTSATTANCYYKSGFLAGAHVGVGFGNGKFNSSNYVPIFPNPTSGASGSARKTAPLFGVHAGYRHIMNEGYTIGFNLEANFFGNSELKKRLSHSFTGIPLPALADNSLKKTYSIIPSIVLGKVICGRYHVSLGLGVPFTRFRHQVTIGSTQLTSSSKTRVGFAPLIGIEYATTKNVSVFANASYEIYKKVNTVFNQSGGSRYTSSISPRQLVLKAGVSYRF